ncbi:hypothetical protein VKT23_001227 [Stygiomarasmius scandens]|uniref:Alpha-type protein kinase domain-containing protein n=1 Tax=Marasmiellus scandens TaxID=2682957 RepID=A0ABR1K6H0_9AGAR
MTSTSSTISNATITEDPKKCPDCLARFDFKTSIGPCGRCFRLNAEQDSEKLEKIKPWLYFSHFPCAKAVVHAVSAWPRNTVVIVNVRHTSEFRLVDLLSDPSPSVVKVAAINAGAQDEDLQNLTTTADMWRSQTSQARFKGKDRPKPQIPNMPTPYATSSHTPTPSNGIPNQSSTQFVVPTSAPNDLSSRPSAGQTRSQNTKDPQIGFIARTMFNNKEVPRFGKILDSASCDVAMPDVIDRILARVNNDWDKISQESLIRHDVCVRLFGNTEPLEDSMNHPIGAFYQMHSAHSQAPVYLKRDPKYKFVPGAFLCFEIHIDPQAYQVRTGHDIPAEIGPSTKKRKSTANSRLPTPSSQATPSRIASQTATGLRSSSKMSAVTFEIPSGNIDDRGNIEMRWEKSTKWTGQLSDSPFAKGKMKMAFEFIRDDGERFVAKRFFNVGQGRDKMVDLSENTNYLLQEHSNILRGNMWLNEFYDLADEGNVEVSKTFSFTECYLAHEVIPDDGFASYASGVREKSLTGEDEVFWLIEPKRARAVDRWSGSMDHPNVLGKRHQTIMAFAHYTLEISKGSLVYVDLQSTPGVHSQTGLATDILFDVGTHSNSDDQGLTGPGDFGRIGIETFERQHKCLGICQKLGLVAFDAEEDDDVDNEPARKKGRYSDGSNAELLDDDEN